MAKKQNHKPTHAKTTLPRRDRSSDSIVQKGNEPFTNWEFGVSIVFLAFSCGYLSLFLFTETQVGHRFGAYQALCLNLDFYWAFWTGAPGGTFHWFDRWPIALGIAFHYLMAYGTGKLVVCGLLENHSTGSLEKQLLAIGTGLAMISTYTLLVGLLQLYPLKHLLVFPVLATAIAGFLWTPSLRVKGSRGLVLNTGLETRQEQEPTHWTHRAWLVGIPFACFIFFGSMIPPWEFDVREYHLQVPKEWYQNGGVSFLSHNVYGNMPLGIEIHALFAMLYSWGADDWWWGAIIGKTISGCFAPLNFAMVYAIGKRLFGPFAGVTAAILYISTPWTTANSIIGYNESGISFYLLGSALILLAHLQSKDQPFPFRTTFLLGVFLGAALACKYTALPFVVLPVMAFHLFIIFRRAVGRPAWHSLAICLLGIGLLGGPWYAKNLYFTGNPTYPLLETVFKSSRTPAQIKQWGDVHSPPETRESSLEVQQTFHSLTLSHKWLSPLVVPFLLLSFFSKRKIQVYSILAFLVFTLGIWWFFTHRLERFLFPFFPVACLLAGSGCHWLSHRRWKSAVTVSILLCCFFNFILASSRLTGDVRILASLRELDVRKLDARDYHHPQGQIMPLEHLSPEMAWLNQNHPTSKVLLFGECRPFGAVFPNLYNTCFDPCETWKRFQGKTPEQFHATLRKERIEFILLNVPELKRLARTYGYNVPFENHQVNETLIFSLEPHILQRIFPPEPSNRGTFLFRVLP